MNHGEIVAQGNTSDIKRIHGSGLLLTCLFQKTDMLEINLQSLIYELNVWQSKGIVQSYKEFTRSKDNRLIKLEVGI